MQYYIQVKTEAQEVIVEMQIFALNFLFYAISGVWRPTKWSSKCSKCLYSVLNIFSLYLLTFLLLTQLIDIIFIVDNVHDFTMNVSIFLSIVAVYCKAVIVTIRRGRIISLIIMLQEKPCKACNEEEINIQMKYDRLIRQVFRNTNMILNSKRSWIIYLQSYLLLILIKCKLNIKEQIQSR